MALKSPQHGLTATFRTNKATGKKELAGWVIRVRGTPKFVCGVREAPTGEAADRIYAERFKQLWQEVGRPPSNDPIKATVGELFDLYLHRMEARIEGRRLEPATFAEYEEILVAFSNFDGGGNPSAADRLRPWGNRLGNVPFGRLEREMFDDYTNHMGRTLGVYRRNKVVIVVRMAFKWASRNVGLDGRLPPYGEEFIPASRREFRRARREKRMRHGLELFEPAEIREQMQGKRITYQMHRRGKLGSYNRTCRAGLAMRAMILLALNAGYHNKDIGEFPLAQVERLRKSRWCEYGRAKTGADRRVWIWDETMAAIEAYLAKRPVPKAGYEHLLFITRSGGPYYREYLTPKGKRRKKDQIAFQYDQLLTRLDQRRPGRLFKALRKTFRTTAAEVGDQMVTDLIMGHAEDADDMRAIYTVRVLDEKIKQIVMHVHQRFEIADITVMEQEAVSPDSGAKPGESHGGSSPGESHRPPQARAGRRRA